MSSPLSAKAKGKQRAVDVDEEVDLESGPSREPLQRTFTVLFTDGLPDLELTVGETDTVKDVKTRIRGFRPTLQKRVLRLIHSGRILTNDTVFYAWLSTLEARQQRAVNSENATEDGSATSEDVKPKIKIHCSIGPEMTQEEEDESVQTAQLTPLRGFDRLASAGFSPEDIATIRRQFHTSRTGLDLDAVGQVAHDDEARALEERWIDDMDGGLGNLHGNSPDDPNSLYATLLQGILLGFFYPLLPFFFIREARPAAFFSDTYAQLEAPPSIVFSKRMQMAIVIGFLVNMAYGVLRSFAS
ncbi:hypothetical protein BOTBODRAFT_109072 [Botryobasidium botryosum FD-172 SS1]|uniref:Ubiquitin-like domain-containing protein n=1 Tax=Botryobasidium botryosum (strain FD-172 SS1) TaxID=930990 RepID=A0A067MHI0_BOTB1|nr:hypothetical protein BOTBODRAFT_109072 [Botryobasidium botryosum FD-172 SS1]